MQKKERNDDSKMQEKTREKAKEPKEASAGVLSRQESGVWKKRLRRLGTEVLWGCGAWLMGQAPMLFNTYPLGLALLCASKRHTLSLLIGLLASAFWQMPDPTVYICTYIAAAVIRITAGLLFDAPNAKRELPNDLQERLKNAAQSIKSEDNDQESMSYPSAVTDEKIGGGRGARVRAMLRSIFNERVRLRMCTGAVCIFIIALYRIIAGGFRYYDLFAALFVLAVTPAAVPVYSICLEDQQTWPGLVQASRAALLFSLVWSSSGAAVSGFPLAVMLGLFFTLYAVQRFGLIAGAVAAILCGLAHLPMLIPAFLLAALVFSFSATLQRERGGVLLSLVAFLFWAIYVSGVESILTLVPAALIAGTAFGLYTRLFYDPAAESVMPGDDDIRLRVEGERRRDSGDRFRGISDAFSSLSEMFYNLSDRFRRPGTLDLRRICDSSFDRFCKDCPNKTICWGLEYSNTLGAVNGLISALHTKGKVTREQIPKALSHRCESVEAILEEINRECAKLTGDMLRDNRTEIFAMDYEAAANIINDALEEDDGEYRFDPILEERVAEYLADVSISAHSVTVYGNRRRRILVRGVDVERTSVTMETLAADLGEMCGLELGRPIFEVEGNVSTMILQAKQKISVIGAQNNVSADGGISGDSINLFSNKKDYFYALINDGMGSGKEAAMTSTLCSVFLEKMLRAGNRAGTSLRMLNNMIRSRGVDSTRECSSTVDLMELDLMTAEASFIKSGAAPSFVIRGTVVHRLQSGTAPIGIICALDVQSTPFQLKPGDTVVMISDGILQDDPDAERMMKYLSGVGGLTPDEIVYNICLEASNREDHDDCSAVAIRIQALRR